ncbi:MAG: hypothetical protein PHU42_02425 [Patescibacteria group bacterium]|nr:hypothetical protein [Patescibacteria group bacterium]
MRRVHITTKRIAPVGPDLCFCCICGGSAVEYLKCHNVELPVCKKVSCHNEVKERQEEALSKASSGK